MQYIQFIPWLIALGSLIVAYKSYSHNVSKDSVTKIDNIKDGLFKANMKLDTVCQTTNETRTDIKSLNRDLVEVEKRVVALERDSKTLFNEVGEIKDSLGKGKA